MAYLAVDKDGTEWVWSYCPLRNKYRGVWDAPYNDDDYVYRSIDLPKGSIEKLIGRILTWADEPYKPLPVMDKPSYLKITWEYEKKDSI